LHRHPALNLRIVPLRGNVATRLAKAATELDATLLAAAGLQRLGLTVPGATFLTPEEMLPAAGQGILALEFRADDNRTKELLAPLHHRPTAFCLAAERGFLNLLEGGCQLPVAALATYREPKLELEALIADADGRRLIRGRKTAEVNRLEAAAELGRILASDLLGRGGADILKDMKERELL
jgi:hydroxymethylbilane synthase